MKEIMEGGYISGIKGKVMSAEMNCGKGNSGCESWIQRKKCVDSESAKSIIKRV